MSKQAVGSLLREWRKEYGFTIDTGSEWIGISRSVLGQIETGKSYPSAETLAKLYLNTNISAGEIFTAILEE